MMQISILVPVHNWDISSLLDGLLREIEASGLEDEVEVVVMDDASTDAGLSAGNDPLVSGKARPFLRYRALGKNVGRSAIRNLLAAEASGTFLLFLDCDVVPDREDFIRAYLSRAQSGDWDVVCGGVSYRSRVLNAPEYDYHAYLGNRKEVKAAAQRNQAPWRHILTSNVMVRKVVFQGTPFNERFTGYGYEDVEWGVRLAESFRILHIDNTVSHLGLVTKAKAYEKMRNSVQNYLLLKELCPAAFHASSVSRLAGIFGLFGSRLLQVMERGFKRCFLSDAVGNRVAFVLFQLNFAVLLALALKEKRP